MHPPSVPSFWYAMATAGIVAVVVLCFYIHSILQRIALPVTHAFRKHIIYTSISILGLFRRQPPLRDILLTIAYISTNGVCIGVGINSTKELSTRCASLLATNLILLLPGASLAADSLRISLRSYQKVHYVIGLVALFEGSLHAALELAKHKWSSNIVTVSGLVAFSCLGFMCITATPAFRSRLYEIFRAIHFGCSALVCVSLWLHVSASDRTAKIQAILGACVWVASYVYRYLLLLYRNFSLSRPRTSVTIHNVRNSLRLDVTLPRPWKVRPGQYIYLTMARPGLFSIFQRHPFMVADSKKHNSMEVRIQPRAGFTRRLLEATLGGATDMNAFVEGPYGCGFDLREYGTIVLFASGIGITSQLPYIQELVQDYLCSATKTRDLLLIWYVESKDQRDLVGEVMDELLREDKLPRETNHGMEFNSGRNSKARRRLEASSTPDRPGLRPATHGESIIDAYIYGEHELYSLEGLPVSQKREGSRIAEIRGEPNIPQIISDVLDTRQGRVAICVCANRRMRYRARETVAQNKRVDVRYLEPDFQPPEPKYSSRRKRSLSVECRGTRGV